MEYCAQSRDELAGAVASLKLFELLRTRGFIQPSGYTYLLTLQSCLRLERLEPANASAVKSTGQVILGDVQEHGFQALVADELRKQVVSAYKQVQVKSQTKIRRINKERNSPDTSVMSLEELARIALFCHHHGMSIPVDLVDKLLRLHRHLPALLANELASVKRSLQKGPDAVAAPRSGVKNIPTKRVIVKRTAAKTKRVAPIFAQESGQRRPRSKSYQAAVRAATDARWGAVLERIATDKD